jgi:hypothetical protein
MTGEPRPQTSFDRLAYKPAAVKRVERTIALVGLAVAVAWVTVALQRPGPDWSPLGPFPVQQITTDQPIDVNIGTVGVDGTTCYSESSQVTGSLAWKSLDPAGLLLGRLEFPSATKLGGCVGVSFDNPIPSEVATAVCDGGPTRWAIVGSETPTGTADDDGAVTPRDGLSLGWETESFVLVC